MNPTGFPSVSHAKDSHASCFRLHCVADCQFMICHVLFFFSSSSLCLLFYVFFSVFSSFHHHFCSPYFNCSSTLRILSPLTVKTCAWEYIHIFISMYIYIYIYMYIYVHLCACTHVHNIGMHVHTHASFIHPLSHSFVHSCIVLVHSPKHRSDAICHVRFETTRETHQRYTWLDGYCCARESPKSNG